MISTEKTNPIDPRQADAGYKPFPSFAEWSVCKVDTGRWDRYTRKLGDGKELSSSLLREARAVVERAAAVDTGALEGLYETDRGFTFTVAVEAAIWQATVEEVKGPRVLALIESQLKAYDFVLDFATQQVPIGEAWIRTLHAEICRNQETYTAYTEVGVQELPLPKGEYKHLPNHVLRKDGKIHSYAPVDLTPAEMHRFCVELRSEAFLQAHPVLQASYAHYAFVLIHPFADGNGRVARALASIFTYRSNSIPLLILTENKKEYLESLAAADEGRYQPFVDFLLERGLDAIRLFDESVRAAAAPAAEEAVDAITRLFVTKGGYSHNEVDEAGYLLAEIFYQEIVKQIGKLRLEGMLNSRAVKETVGYGPTPDGYRLPVTRGALSIAVEVSTVAPAQASISRRLSLDVPKDCGRDDDIIIRNIGTNDVFEARITELLPTPTAALHMRVSIAVERIIGMLVNDLSSLAAKSLNG